jgi:hypothetical protein
VRVCIFAYSSDLCANKITKKLHKTPSEKNVPKCSFAYSHICFQGKEITALEQVGSVYLRLRPLFFFCLFPVCFLFFSVFFCFFCFFLSFSVILLAQGNIRLRRLPLK